MLERLEQVRQRLMGELAAQEGDEERMERIRGMVGRHGLGPARTDNMDVAKSAEAGPASMNMMAPTCSVDGPGGGRSQARGWKRKLESGDEHNDDTTMRDEVAPPEASTHKGIDRGVVGTNDAAEPQMKKLKMMTANGAAADEAGAEDGAN